MAAGASWVGRPHRLWHRLGLRFARVEEEHFFRKSLSSSSASTHEVPAIFFTYALFVAVFSGIVYVHELTRADGVRFSWEAGDPRTKLFAAEIACAAVALLTAVLSVSPCKGRICRCMDRELLWPAAATGVVLLSLLSTSWVVPASGSQLDAFHDFAYQGFGNALLVHRAEVMVTLGCVHLPVRCCVLWVLPASGLIGLAVVPWVAAGAGVPMPERWTGHVVLLLLVLCSAFWGACRKERQARALWVSHSMQSSDTKTDKLKQEEDLQDETRWSHLLNRRAQNDLVVALDRDLRFRGSGPAEEAFFGTSVESRHITDFLVPDDRRLFARAATKISAVRPVVSLTAAVRGSYGVARRRLLLVDSGRAEPRMLVGFGSADLPHQLLGDGQGQSLSVLPIPSELITTMDSGGSSGTEAGPMMRLVSNASSISDPIFQLAAVSVVNTLSYTLTDLSKVEGHCVSTQTDTLQRQDVEVETNIAWDGQVLRCKCCAKPPPIPPHSSGSSSPSSSSSSRTSAGSSPRGAGNHASASSSQRRRRSPVSPVTPVDHQAQHEIHAGPEADLTPFEGRWVAAPESMSEVNDWLQTFTIRAGKVIDGLGYIHLLACESGVVQFRGGNLMLQGDTMYRVGRSGVRLTFLREPGHQRHFPTPALPGGSFAATVEERARREVKQNPPGFALPFR